MTHSENYVRFSETHPPPKIFLVCWFLGKNLSNFMYPAWKRNNQYYLNGHPEKAAMDCSPFRWSRNYKLLYSDYFLLQIIWKIPLFPYYPYFNIHKLESQIRLPKGHLIGSQQSVFFQKLLLIDEFFIQMHSMPLFYISEFDNVVFMFMSTAKTGPGH